MIGHFSQRLARIGIDADEADSRRQKFLSQTIERRSVFVRDGAFDRHANQHRRHLPASRRQREIAARTVRQNVLRIGVVGRLGSFGGKGRGRKHAQRHRGDRKSTQVSECVTGRAPRFSREKSVAHYKSPGVPTQCRIVSRHASSIQRNYRVIPYRQRWQFHHHLPVSFQYILTFFVWRPTATMSFLPSPSRSATARSSTATPAGSKTCFVHFVPSASPGS